ncbi:MAG: hypothetical protein J1E62_04520, partial [Lachnospiraceae bacterium]|nr:hypothetical protein [Lachnospiraceae bacterium]
YLSSVSLRKDETIHCGTVEWHGGRISANWYDLTVKGNMEVTDSSRLNVNSGKIIVEKDLTIKDGGMEVLGDSQLHVGGDLRIGEQGQLSTDWTGGGNPDLYVQENLVVNSLKQTNLKYGTLFLEGDLIQEDSGYETSLNVTNNFRIECVGEGIQTIDLAYPDCVPLGTMDFRNSMGVEIVADEIHGRELIGFEKIVWKEKQKFYLTNVSLRKDETIHCETVDWHVGRLSVGQYHLTVKGNLEMTGSSRLDVNSGTLTVEKNLTIKDGKMDVLGDSQLHVKGDFRIGEQGQLSTDWTGSGYPELYVQGDMVVNSAKQSILKYGTLRLEGDFVQIDDSDIENLKIEYAFNVVLEGKNRQTINLEGVESIPDLDLSESKEVYLAGDYSGRELEGVEKIVCDGETVYLDYTEAVTSSDGTIDGSLKCYGKLIVNWHTLTIKGKYTQYGGTLVKNGGKLVTAGDFTAAKAEVELEDGTIHVKGDTNIKKNACINMRAFEKSHFRTDGDYTSASRRDDYSTGGGTLEVKGDLIKEDSATSFGLYLSGTHLFFSGSHEQSVKTKDAEFGSVASIDMRQSDVVSFSCRSIHTMKIRGFSHIKTDESNNALMLCNSSIHLEEDDSYNGDIMLFNSNFDCNGKSFHISGSLEQTDSTMILNGGGLYIGKHYSIMGNGYLRMTQESELLHVDGTFSTCAEQSHDRLLTNGRMELGGNFNQTGNENSFKTTGGFVIAFIGEKEQLVCFKTYEYAGFANIDPKYNEFMRTEEPDELMDRVIYRISKGFISGLKEASGIEILEDIANNYAMLLGIGTLVAASVVFWPVGLVLSVCIAIYSIFIIAKSAGGIYSTLTGDGDIYDKAEAFGHDAALMLVSVFFLKGSVDGMAKNISACKNAVKGLIGRIKRFNLLEFLGTATSYETIVDYESFIKYASEFAEADALSYIKTVAKETDSIETLKKVGKLLEEGKGKLGRLLKLDEVKVGVETLLEGGDVAKALAAVEEFKAGGYITNIVDDIDNIAQEIIDINKKYSDGFEMNNSVHNILNSASYYDDPYEQVAAVIRSISDHAFANGNKRTAFDTLNLLLNKLRLKDILTDAQKWDLIYDIAEGRIKNVKNIASILSGK